MKTWIDFFNLLLPLFHSGLTLRWGAHKAGKNDFTGTYWGFSGYKTQQRFGQTHSTIDGGKIFGFYTVQVPQYNRLSGVSEGCFLIGNTNWSSFMNHFPAGVGRIGVINK